MKDVLLKARVRSPTAGDSVQTKCNLSTSVCEVVNPDRSSGHVLGLPSGINRSTNMSQNFLGLKPMKVGEIVFKDGTIIEDRIVFNSNGFLCVVNEDGTEPTMYNTDTISKLVSVSEAKAPTMQGQLSY